jgi:hypothetical protein
MPLRVDDVSNCVKCVRFQPLVWWPQLTFEPAFVFDQWVVLDVRKNELTLRTLVCVCDVSRLRRRGSDPESGRLALRARRCAVVRHGVPHRVPNTDPSGRRYQETVFGRPDAVLDGVGPDLQGSEINLAG